MSTSPIPSPIIAPARPVSVALPSMPRASSMSSSLSDLVGQKMLVVFLVLAVVVVVLLCYIARDHCAIARSSRWPRWSHHSALCAAALAVVFLLAAWGTYRAYTMSMSPNVLLGLFLAVAAVYLLAFHQFYYCGRYRNAFWLMVLATVLVAVHVWFAWKTGDQQATLLCVPLLAVSALIAWMFWDAGCGYGGKGGRKGGLKGGKCHGKGYQQSTQQDEDDE